MAEKMGFLLVSIAAILNFRVNQESLSYRQKRNFTLLATILQMAS